MNLPAHQLLKQDRGAAMVEFALVLPLLMLVLLGIVDFARALNYSNDANQLAAEAARYAAVDFNPGGSGQTLQDYVQQQAIAELRDGGSGGVPAPAQLCIDFPGDEVFPVGSTEIGAPVRVRVTATFVFLPFVSGRTSLTDVTLEGEAVMRLEQEPTDYDAGCSGG